ncbi:hypothetical protein FKG94_22625 [Exilibacterium tricleocarpae]|uniref:Flagellar FliJ protein n=1 Tax=Exilibacterium tricleocarpae TaxID=2591008 RepID=A0A545SYB2_9GAMM|nr:YscO family type III secretion system apparatus protein [Exilibacterium tricleocarpae]TQV69950.1 hypothetical protein FKG94_22625 [Exilibacterium tricleocarpae]
MLKMLESVLKVRQLLEEKAIARTCEIERQLEQTVAVCEQARQGLADYRRWREGREAELFSQLRTGLHSVSYVSTYRDSLQKLAADEAEMISSAAERERQVGEIQMRLGEARLAQVAAVRSREKITNIIDREKDQQMEIDVKSEDEENDELANLGWYRTDNFLQ